MGGPVWAGEVSCPGPVWAEEVSCPGPVWGRWYPCPGPDWGTPSPQKELGTRLGYPSPQKGPETGVPPTLPAPLWTDKQSENITFPRISYAGVNEFGPFKKIGVNSKLPRLTSGALPRCCDRTIMLTRVSGLLLSYQR